MPLVSAKSRTIRTEACWAVSNIAAGTASQVDALVTTPGMLPAVLAQASAAANMLVRKEAAWVLSNACSNGSASSIRTLVAAGALPIFSDLLDFPDTLVLIRTLEALALMLIAAPEDSYEPAFEEAGGVDKLEQLLFNENKKVHTLAGRILTLYFNDGEPADPCTSSVPAGVAPVGGGPAHYAFGAELLGDVAACDFSVPR